MNHAPVATPRNLLQKLTEEQSKEVEEIVEKKSEEIVPQTPPRPSTTESATAERTVLQLQAPGSSLDTEPLPKLNVSKVMLNVDETSISEENANELIEHIFSQKIIQTSNTTLSNGGQNISRTQINGKVSEPISSTPKKKSVSVVELNIDEPEVIEIEKRLTELEHAELSKEINEIIDKAVEVNETRLTAAINGNEWLTHRVNEVNNNHTVDVTSKLPQWMYTTSAPPTLVDGEDATVIKLDENCTEIDSGLCAASREASLSSNNDVKNIDTTVEPPIEPIICEKSPIDFYHENSDNSLPTSSTYGTMSTEPESLRTSDIEDGYKGNISSHAAQVNGEQLVENEFEFLSNERYNEVSPKINNGIGKADVIEELTNIISANRLDTVIKSIDENDAIDANTVAAKRSTLSNFQIGAYNSSDNHDNLCTKKIAPIVLEKSPAGQRYKRHSLVENAFEDNENIVKRSTTPKRVSLTNGLGLSIDTDGNTDVDSNVMKAQKYVSRSKSFHSTLSWSAVRNANANNRSESQVQTPQRGLTDATRQRSSSELSIADSPLLQSVEVLKSIMNSSRKNSFSEKPVTIKMNTTNKPIEENTNHVVFKKLPLHATTNGNGKPNVETKTWKYEGPPSINLSTWGERPKSQVFIKSDNDYKFGGMSKMAALQKRFSTAITNTDEFKRNVDNDLDACNLPIVRGVEYKRTLSTDRNGNNGNVSSVDAIDSEVELRPVRRPSYEISRIVSDKTNNYTTMTLGRVTSATKKEISPTKEQFAQNRNTFTKTNGNVIVQRVTSFNANIINAPVVNRNNNTQQNESRPVKQQQPLVKLSTYEAAPPFSQFTLRKTGLKEKILLDESNKNINCNNVDDSQLKTHYAIQRTADEQKNKRNTIPSAPKPPPPPPQKPFSIGGRKNGGNGMQRNQSMSVDPRNQLLDSIRNFNRTVLKKC